MRRHVITTMFAPNTHSVFTFKIEGDLTYDSSNVINLLQCAIEKLLYIRQTETLFKIRFDNHKANVESIPNLPLSMNMLLPELSLDKVTVILLQSGFQSHREREIRKSYFSSKFNTLADVINESPGMLSARKCSQFPP